MAVELSKMIGRWQSRTGRYPAHCFCAGLSRALAQGLVSLPVHATDVAVETGTVDHEFLSLAPL